MGNDNTVLIKVANDSRPAMVAGAIAGFIREGKTVAIQAIGASATHRMVVAVVHADSFLKENGLTLQSHASQHSLKDSEFQVVRLDLITLSRKEAIQNEETNVSV